MYICIHCFERPSAGHCRLICAGLGMPRSGSRTNSTPRKMCFHIGFHPQLCALIGWPLWVSLPLSIGAYHSSNQSSFNNQQAITNQPTINQCISQHQSAINQSINQPTHQSINRSFEQALNRQSINQSMNQSSS